MISCYALALWVLNMRVKFHSLGLPQSLKNLCFTSGKASNFWGDIYFDAEVNWKSKTRCTYFMTQSYCRWILGAKKCCTFASGDTLRVHSIDLIWNSNTRNKRYLMGSWNSSNNPFKNSVISIAEEMEVYQRPKGGSTIGLAGCASCCWAFSIGITFDVSFYVSLHNKIS